MPQARLPDINTAFNFHRGKAITNLGGRNYVGAIGSLYAFNNCLQKEYQIKISTKVYNEKVNQDMEVVCSFCQEQIKRKDIQTYQSLNSGIALMLTGKDYQEVWDCPKCHKSNKLSKTRFIQKVLAKPYCIKLVPEPPIRQDGLMDSITFNKRFDAWFWQFMDELEAAAAKFRDDNWQKSDNLGNMDSEINTDGEDEL